MGQRFVSADREQALLLPPSLAEWLPDNRRIDRFRRRGLAHCLAEWRLITATHNLLKLWKATPATA